MIETISQCIGIGLVCALFAAWRAIPLLGAVLLIDLLFRRRIKARLKCFLWMLVLARLMLPFSVSSPLSTTELADNAGMSIADRLLGTETKPKPEFEVTTFQLFSGEWVSLPVLPDEASADERSRAEAFAASVHADRMAERNNVNSTTASTIPATEPFNEDLILYPLVWGWAVVLLAMVSMEFIKYRRFALHLRRCTPITEPSIVDAVAQVCKSMNIARCPEILQVDSLPAPSVFGIRKPVLCLTSRIELSLEELTWVLRHELAHVKRWDSLILTFAQAIRACHWFNPIAWLVVSKLRAGIEQAADELATEGMSTEDIVRYGHLLLRSATQSPSHRNFAIVGLLSIASKNSLKRRISMLGASRSTKHWSIRLIVTLLFGVLATAGLTDAPSEEAASHGEQTDMQSKAIATSINISGWTEEAQPEELVTFDVSAAMEKARSLQPGIDAEQFGLKWFGPHSKECTFENGRLKAMLPQYQARMMAEQIRGFELSGPWQINIECRMVDAPVSLARNLDWDSTAFTIDGRILLGNTPQSDPKTEEVPWAKRLKSEFATRPALETKLSEIDLAMLIHRYQSHSRTNCFSAPKVTFFNGQSITIANNSLRPFVTGFSKETSAPTTDRAASSRDSTLFQPIIETIPEGVSLRVKAQVVGDNQVELDCLITESEIRSADSVSTLPIASADNPKLQMVIQSPLVQYTNLCSHVTLDDNQSVCFFSPRSQQSKEGNPNGRIYILTVHRIDDSEGLKSFVPK